MTPPQLFVGSFALLVCAGAAGLKILPGIYTDAPLNWIDAVFMSTSAVCVTGLSVVDLATVFTPAGQAFMLLLIQLGGLGILTFSSLIILALGGRLSLRQESASIVSEDTSSHVDRRRLALDIVRFTVAFEAAGTAALYFLWAPRLGWREALWPAAFHSISAFCNSGFSTFSDSLIGYQQSPLSLLVIMLLIIAGGLGFLTHEEVYLRVVARCRHQAFRMSLQSRIVLLMTVFLIMAGWLCFAILEWDNALRGLDTHDRLMNSLFMSVTPRTAGFNAIDYGKATDSSNLLTILLMTVGGSPGSTAGGIKTTTFALIGLLALSRLRGLETTTCYGRSVPEDTTSRAVGLFVIASAVSTAGVFGLTTTEVYSGSPGSLIHRMFEAVSAFNTVGLSMGITPGLSREGRCISIVLMFFGRVGLLTLAASLTRRHAPDRSFRYAYEDVVVG